MSEKFNIRTIIWHNRKYARLDDIAELLREVAATEETDVRNRLNELADNLHEKNDED